MNSNKLIRNYPNGGFSIHTTDGSLLYVVYNTGDEVSFSFPKWWHVLIPWKIKSKVIRVRTFDGLTWKKGQKYLSSCSKQSPGCALAKHHPPQFWRENKVSIIIMASMLLCIVWLLWDFLR